MRLLNLIVTSAAFASTALSVIGCTTDSTHHKDGEVAAISPEDFWKKYQAVLRLPESDFTKIKIEEIFQIRMTKGHGIGSAGEYIYAWKNTEIDWDDRPLRPDHVRSLIVPYIEGPSTCVTREQASADLRQLGWKYLPPPSFPP